MIITPRLCASTDQGCVRQAQERPHVQVYLLDLSPQRKLGELSNAPQTSVVHEQIDVTRTDPLLYNGNASLRR